MAKTEQQLQQEKEDIERIAHKVLTLLGKPPGLIEVAVRHVKNHSYRVNVIIRDSSTSDVVEVLGRRIAHSYFIVEYADIKQLVFADPTIKKIY